jgi:transposase-like protein
MVQVNITKLIDEVQCYQTVRELRWPDGVACPSCESTQVIKRGFDDTEPARQRYECHDCDQRFDDLTDTIFAGHHQPLKVWILCKHGQSRLCWLIPDRPKNNRGGCNVSTSLS